MDDKKDVVLEEFYSGKIIKDRGNGMYDVEFDDGDSECLIPDTKINDLMSPLGVGDKVCRVSNSKLPGRIVKDHKNDTFDIDYEDKTTEQKVSAEFLRLLIKRLSYSVGDKVVRYANPKTAGKIVKDHQNGSYDINYDDKTSETKINGELIRPLIVPRRILRVGDKGDI